MHAVETESYGKSEAGKGRKGAPEETHKCPDDNSDAPPVKLGRPMKDDALVRRLAKQAGVRPEIILLTDRVEYVEEEEEEEEEEEDDDDDDY